MLTARPRHVLRSLWLCLFLILPFSALMTHLVAAQDATPEPTVEATLEATPDVTAEATPDATPDATAETTPEPAATLPPNALLDFPGAGEYTVQLRVGGYTRTIAVYIPTTYEQTSEAFPLVVVMHGAGGTGNGIESFSGWSQLSETENFIVIYPDGLANAWNDGRPGDPGLSSIDDVSFITASINFISDKLNIDQNRVYATGFSMGGMMSFRLACQLNDRIAAIASVASTMPEYVMPFCSQGETMPVLIIQGTSDTVVPFYGVPRQGRGYLSAANSLIYWARQNECETRGGIEPLEDVDPHDGTRVLLETATDCANDADVMLYGVYHGGHNYPGYNLGAELGTTSLDINATQVIWEFFEAHPRVVEGGA